MTLVVQASILIVRPATTYRALDLGAGAGEVGLLVAGYALFPALLALPLGRFSDRHRPITVLAGGALLLGASSLLTGVAPSLGWLAVGTCLQGVGAVAAMIGGQSLVARLSSADAIDRDFGHFTAIVSLGQMIGPLLGGAVVGLHVVGVSSTFLACALAGVLCLLSPLACLRIDDRRNPTGVAREVPAGAFGLLRLPGVPGGIVASVALLTAIDITIAYLPLLGEHRGFGPAVVGVLLSLRAGASVGSRVLIPVMLARWGRARLLVASTCGSAVFMALLPVSRAPWEMGLVMVLAGFFLGIGQPLSMSQVAQAVPLDVRGAALSLRLAGNKVGQTVVPAGVGVVAGSTGASSAFWMLGALLAGSSLGVSPRREPGADPPQ
jgi:MFS family permease